ncbi:hypothetical protein LCGC14_1914380 [marine sediment metagenome]|uniref:Bacteriophage T4 Gp32 single-stranded DNA-binding domain-containing protein n=1 Tax=marine sediment metagenome TaxID=412755 RepID=A0A0F9FSH2_9ZZZZ
MAGKGTSYFTRRSRERQAQFSNPFVYLREDLEQARIRFLEEPADGLYSGVFHRPYVKGRLENPVICVEQDDDAPQLEGMTDECPLCRTGDKPGMKFFVWVYVYYLLHPHQNPALDKDPQAPKWKAVKVGKGAASMTMFKQDVNKLKILLGGPRLKDEIDNAVAAAAENDATLLDADYRFVRHGVPNSSDTRYNFVAIGKSGKLKEEVTKAIDELGDIADAAMEGSVEFFTNPSTAEESEEPEEEEQEETAEEEAEAESEAAEEEAEESSGDAEFATL